MMSVPLGNNDYFYPGSVVVCTLFGAEEDVNVKGEVYAFDHDSRVLLLKHPATNGKKDHNNVTLINMNCVRNVQVLKECNDTPPPLPPMEHKKLLQRFQQEKDLRLKVSQAVSDGVTKVGVELYLYMKRIFKETTFNKENIVIMEDVTIEPPYKRLNCSANNPQANQCLLRVQNMVERFYDEKSRTSQSQSSTT